MNVLQRIRRFWLPWPGPDHPLTEEERRSVPATAIDEVSSMAEGFIGEPRQLEQALAQSDVGVASVDHSTGLRHDVLVWVDRHLRTLPSGSAILHPVATYGHKATNAVVAIFFTLAATWYWVSERDRMIELLTALAPESKRAKARTTYLEIDRRLGAYTRVKFLMVGAIGLVLSAGFYAVGLHYWLLVGGFVSLVEIIPMTGPSSVRSSSWRRPVRCLRRHRRHSGHVRRCDADRRARARPRAAGRTRRGAPSPSPAIDAGVGIWATLPRSRWYGSASGFIRREGRDPTLEQGAIPVA